MAPEDKSDEQNGTDALAELNAERAQFDLAERAARFGYWRVRLADQHTVWSPGMYRLLNIDQGQRADMTWLLARIVDEDVQELTQRIATAIKTRAPFHYRSRPKDPANPAQYVDTHGEVEIGPDGLVTSILGVCHDVTQQVIAETQRAAAEDRYRLMAEQASDIIMLYGSDARILFASPALQNILGRTPNEIEDGHFLAHVHPEDLQQAQYLREQLRPGEVRTVTCRMSHRDGHYVWIESTVRAVFDDQTGAMRNIVSVSRDVSQRKNDEMKMKAAQEDAEAASRAKSGFLAGMSHELRTPLNAIIGFADIMRDEMFGPLGHERYSEYATLIYDSGQHLLDLISDILDMAKIEAGKLELNFERVDLAGSIEDCARLMADRAREKGVQLVAEVPEGGLPLMADRRAVKQILLNLLSNAVKFTPRGGHIRIRAEADADRVSVSVRDDGIGIPPEALPRLGRAFEQVATNPFISKTGTGLGLALVRSLCERHGGEIRIESLEGVGTTVTVTLALLPPAQAQAA